MTPDILGLFPNLCFTAFALDRIILCEQYSPKLVAGSHRMRIVCHKLSNVLGNSSLAPSMRGGQSHQWALRVQI